MLYKKPCFKCPYCIYNDKDEPVCGQKNKVLTNGELLICRPKYCPFNN